MISRDIEVVISRTNLEDCIETLLRAIAVVNDNETVKINFDTKTLTSSSYDMIPLRLAITKERRVKSYSLNGNKD